MATPELQAMQWPSGLNLATAVEQYKKSDLRLRSRQREDSAHRFFTLISSAAILSSFMLGVLEKSAFAADGQVVRLGAAGIQCMRNATTKISPNSSKSPEKEELLRIRPSSEHVGADITDVNLAASLANGAFEKIEDAFIRS